MSYKLVHKNILSVNSDAIVNAANTKPVCTPGPEMDLYHEAGFEDMIRERIAIGEIPYGEARATDAFRLRAKHIIHTAIPGSDISEKELIATVRACYRNSLALADELGCKKVAMPILLLNNYRFPKNKAIDLAISSIREFSSGKDMMVYLAVSELEEFVLPEEMITRLDELLGLCEPTGETTGESIPIDEVISKESESFGERFFRYVDEKGLTDAEVYHKANVNRKLISKLRINPDKNVDKKTALALAVGLELDIDQTEEFIKLAGYALSPRIRFDKIVRYFIENGNYNLMELNEALFKYTEKVLVGADK